MASVVFMGTPKFSATILEALVKSNYDVIGVVTQPDRRVGRKHKLAQSPVKQVALENDIPVFQPLKLGGSPEMQKIIDLQPDFIITAAYGQFLPTKLLEAAKVAAVNVHGSLLPKYRGGAPVQYAIMNGEKETGVTIMYMVKKMDAGDMLAKAVLPIGSKDDTESIFEKMSHVGAKALLQTLPKLEEGTIQGQPQDEKEATFAPTIKSSQEELHLSLTAQELDCKVRALRPDPGTYFSNFKGKRTKIWDIEPLDETTDQEAGTVVEAGKHDLKIAAAKGTVYSIKKLQPAGKAQMDITAYLNGSGQGIKKGQRLIKDEDAN